MTDHSKVGSLPADFSNEDKMRSETDYETAEVTRNIGLCNTLREACKREVQSTSFLSR